MLALLSFFLLIIIGGNSVSSTNDVSFPFSSKFDENQLKTVPCPDGNSCDDGETCCELSSTSYACCPHPDAVCCSDHIHCCPQNHTCDLQSGHCKKNLDQLNIILCPDGETQCPTGATCCSVDGGGYGCCPLLDAVCCSDHLHCCPQGKICDIEQSRCVSRISIPWSTKLAPINIRQNLTEFVNGKEKPLSRLNHSTKLDREIVCPDALTLCESTSTCCLTPAGLWGCCPIENAVCCSDHLHCCPTHYKCDLHIFKCDHDQFGSIPIYKTEIAQKQLPLKINLKFTSLSTVICPDENLCPDETTCCQLGNNTYGCCPYQDGQCCSDQIHCCGKGYVCDGSRCTRHFDSLNILKMAKLLKNSLKEDKLCPDGQSKCLINSTCCPNKNSSNDINYSCCPYSKGVCCGSNGSVCCPNNYRCDEQQLSCELDDVILLRENRFKRDLHQCDTSDVFCSSDQTCCATSSTSDQPFACCPYQDAQCCSDGAHCCPLGTTCDMEYGGCLNN